MIRTLFSASLLLVLAACGSAPEGPETERISTPGPALPGKIVWTDGHAAVAVSSAGAASCPATSPDEAAQALAQTNAVRAAAGLPPLRLDARLLRAAEGHACDMARRGAMDHRGTTTSGPAARVKAQGYHPLLTAENIAAGARSVFDLDGTLQQFAASPKHRANTVIPRLQDFGIGHAYSADGKIAFWSVVLADPR